MSNTFSVRITVYELYENLPYQKLLRELIEEFSANNLSSSKTNCWVTINIDEFDRFFLKYKEKTRYFDWLHIFQEKNNIWSNERLIRLKDLISSVYPNAWYLISRRTDIEWNYSLIHSIEDYLDFKSLSGNHKIPWTEQIIDQWIKKWDWANLSGNSSLPWSESFIDKYVQMWKWKPDNLEFAYTCYYKNLPISYPSISTNTFISWDLIKFNKYRKYLDPWLLAKTAKISDEVFILYHDFFLEKHLCGFKHYRYSDWRKSEDVWQTGLEQCIYNANFQLTEKLIEFSKKVQIVITQNSEHYSDEIEEVSVCLFDIWNKKSEDL